MDFKKWQNCLRIQIAPDGDQDVKIDKLVSHCVKYGFTDVIGMINAEELCVGHMTIEEAKPWVALFKKERDKLREHGITFSINTWLEMGHNDRGWTLRSGQEHYHTIVDFEGRKSNFIACILDENFRKDFCEYVTYLCSELQPEMYWIEDDFRFMNHPPIKFPCCFCDLHMKEYNRRLNANYTREELVKKINEKGISKERKVFLDVERESIISFADRIATAVKKGCDKTTVGLMSSGPSAHCQESRDWDKLLTAISRGNEKINRIHLPYGEPSGKEWLYEFNTNAMGVRTLSPKDTIIMPEYENGAPDIFGATPRYTKFKLESASALVLKGMTYSIYGFEGNGVSDEYGYGEAVKSATPYLQGVENLNLDFSTLDGVICPIDQDICYRKPIENNSITETSPILDYRIAPYFSIMGIAFKYSTEKVFKNKVIALCGQNTYNFTDEQIIDLFKNNKVIVDAECARELEKRNLLYLIGAVKLESHPVDTGFQLYEASVTDDVIFGLKRFRATCRWSADEYTLITYDKPVDVLTKTFNEVGLERGAGMTVSKDKKVFVIPYNVARKNTGLTVVLRHYFITKFIDGNNSVIRTDTEGLSPYCYKESGRTVVMVTNTTVDNYAEINLFTADVKFSKVSFVGKDGIIKSVPFTVKDNGFTCIKKPIEYLSQETFIFE